MKHYARASLKFVAVMFAVLAACGIYWYVRYPIIKWHWANENVEQRWKEYSREHNGVERIEESEPATVPTTQASR
jgi:hypothetical protein